MPSGRFDGQVVLITGAGTGIGRVLALADAHAGAKLTIGARRIELIGRRNHRAKHQRRQRL